MANSSQTRIVYTADTATLSVHNQQCTEPSVLTDCTETQLLLEHPTPNLVSQHAELADKSEESNESVPFQEQANNFGQEGNFVSFQVSQGETSQQRETVRFSRNIPSPDYHLVTGEVDQGRNNFPQQAQSLHFATESVSPDSSVNQPENLPCGLIGRSAPPSDQGEHRQRTASKGCCEQFINCCLPTGTQRNQINQISGGQAGQTNRPHPALNQDSQCPDCDRGHTRTEDLESFHCNK